MKNNVYIVPFDFTSVTQKGLDYAIDLAKKVGAEIKLLHVANDKNELVNKKNELEKVIKEYGSIENVTLSSLISLGDIYSEIGKMAKKFSAQLVIMGTHGMRGFQKIAGSHAMKVVTNCECPLLIVQKSTDIKPINEIVLPIDLTKESLQVVNLAGDMAHIFNAKVQVIAEKQSDEMLSTRLKNRVGIISKQYEERGVNSAINYVPKSGGFGKNIMQFVKSNEVGMIALSYHTESLLPQFDTFAQNLITNKHSLPVLIINSKLASALYF